MLLKLPRSGQTSYLVNFKGSRVEVWGGLSSDCRRPGQWKRAT